MDRKTLLSVTAMSVLGALVFAGFGILVEWRQDQPIDPVSDAAARGIAEASPGAALAHGVRASSVVAHRALDGGHRGRAMHAVDGAQRVASVGRDAVTGPVAWALDRAWRLLEEARVDVQNGAPQTARRHLDDVVDLMENATKHDSSLDPPDLDRLRKHTGATVLNALGGHLGEVTSIEMRDGTPVAEVRLGGSSDVLGFIDIGGEAVSVPARTLVWGKPSLVGGLHVVAPVADDQLSSG